MKKTNENWYTHDKVTEEFKDAFKSCQKLHEENKKTKFETQKAKIAKTIPKLLEPVAKDFKTVTPISVKKSEKDLQDELKVTFHKSEKKEEEKPKLGDNQISVKAEIKNTEVKEAKKDEKTEGKNNLRKETKEETKTEKVEAENKKTEKVEAKKN